MATRTDQRTERGPMTAGTHLEPFPVNVRVKISALWASMMFIFAYVDLFSFYRSDVRADIAAGGIVGGAVGGWNFYLLGSALEVVLLAAVAYYAWTWPKAAPVRS